MFIVDTRDKKTVIKTSRGKSLKRDPPTGTHSYITYIDERDEY